MVALASISLLKCNRRQVGELGPKVTIPCLRNTISRTIFFAATILDNILLAVTLDNGTCLPTERRLCREISDHRGCSSDSIIGTATALGMPLHGM